nr:PREDICTED: uncharacterized protein LOC109040707 isoform X1 [Bemisia tabaci]
MSRGAMRENQAKRSRFWCSSEKQLRKKAKGSRVDGLREGNENANQGSLTDDSLSDVEKISRGDYQSVFGLWNDLDQQFWGDDEKDSDSSDFQVHRIENERSDFGTCRHCHAPIMRETNYCNTCYQNRWRWIPRRPTRALRKKEVPQNQRKEAGSSYQNSENIFLSQGPKIIQTQTYVPQDKKKDLL